MAPDSDGNLAVWAVNVAFLRAVCHEIGPRVPRVAVVNVPKTNNPNLRRQEGLFTIVQYRNTPTPPKSIPPFLDDLFRDQAVVTAAENADGIPRLPMLYKFTLPHSEAPNLLYYLHIAGVDASTIFDGLGSIVEGMGEDRFRQVYTRADRVRNGSCLAPGR